MAKLLKPLIVVLLVFTISNFVVSERGSKDV